MFDGNCSYITFIHLLIISYNLDVCGDCKSFYIFCISEWSRSFNIISLSFLVSFGEVKETGIQKRFNIEVVQSNAALNSVG
jgi:hypothetical protein